MTTAAVHEFAVPAPYDVSFTAGELAIGPAATFDGAGGPSTFYLSRYMNFVGGTYTVKMQMAGSGVMWVGADALSLRAIAGINSTSTFTSSFQAYIPAGLQRLEIVLQNILPGPSPCWGAFSIFQSGQLIYASAAEDWLFDTTPIADSELLGQGDQRLLMPVFTVLPNWDTGITENITYQTDIMNSETDDEQRRALRIHARRTFEANFLRQKNKRSRLDNFVAGVGKNQFMFPLWHEQFSMPISLNLGTTEIQFPATTLQHTEFRVDDLVLVINRNPDEWELVKVASIDLVNDILTLVAPPTKSWPRGVHLFPMRVGRMMDTASFTNSTDRVATLSVRFDVDEPEDGVTPSWGYCVPLFRFKIDFENGITVQGSRDAYVIDNQLGKVEVFDPGQRANLISTFSMKMFGRAVVNSMRAFMAMARGSAVRFYMPTFTSDIIPIGDIPAGMTIDAQPMGFYEYMSRPQPARVFFGIVWKDGHPSSYYTIVGVEAVRSLVAPYNIIAERLTLDKPITSTALNTVERLQFMVPSRFAQDSFSFQHMVDGSNVVTTQLVMQSSVLDEMPPIDCFVTSRPYPIEVIEGIDTGTHFTGGSTYQPLFIEALDTECLFTGGTLHVILLPPYGMLAEALDTACVFTDGTLHTILLPPYNMLAEALDTSCVFTSGTLKTILLPPYNMLAEALDTSCVFTSGTLT